MPATNDANPKGYFEHLNVVQAHDRLLAAFGMDWADPRPLPEDWMRHPVTLEIKNELQTVVSKLLAGGGSAVVKDPRLCRFVPLWRDFLAEMGVPVHFAFIIRHPAEVAASLRRRDGMSEYRSGLLSLTYQLEAEEATRGASRLFISYEDLILDWRVQVDRCTEVFGDHVVPRDYAVKAVDGFIDAQLRNHSSADDSRLAPEVLAAYGCLVLATKQPEVLPVVLDEIRSRFEAARRGYAAAIEANLSALAIDRRVQSAPIWSRGLELASAWNAPTLDAMPSAKPRMYGRLVGSAYTEDYAVDGLVDIASGGVVISTMSVPGNFPLEKVRFDPDSAPGVYELLSVTVDGVVVEDLPRRICMVNEHRMAATDKGVAAWAAQGEDPWIELDLLSNFDSKYRQVPCSIKFKYRRVTASLILEEANAERHLGQMRSLERLAGGVAGLEAKVTQLDDSNGLIQREHKAQWAAIYSLLDQQLNQLTVLASQLNGVSEVVSEIKSRSDRPFLHRYKRWRRAGISRSNWESGGWEMLVEPLANVDPSGNGNWVGRNCDPQFMLRPKDQVADAIGGYLSPGWYLLTIESEVHSGRLENPCLYPDYGRGMSGSDRIGLVQYESTGISETVVYLGPGLQVLRLDPSDEDAHFAIKVSLRPLSRAAAWLCMLRRTFGTGAGGAIAVVRRLPELISMVLKLGPRGLRSSVLSSYQLLQSQVANDYTKWIRRHEREVLPCEIEARISVLSRRPLFSIVMPVYQAPEQWLRQALDSVLNQYYPHWELCISDDASPSPHVRKVLEEYRERDDRIKVVYREKNGHISACSNSAIAVAAGEFMVLLDHDDELHQEALLLVAETISENPSVKLIYSDEDKVDELGRRFDPYFKPEWNYDLLLGQNCISHLGVYSISLVRELGGFREGMEGSQDWDLALRCVERIREDQIVHIPRVLYHWRAIRGSTALSAGEKNYAIEAGRQAVLEHLARTSQAAEVHILPASMLQVKRSVTGRWPKLTLVIPTRDRVDLLRTCVDSILQRSTYPDYEVLVVDNGSVEPETTAYLAQIAALDRVRVLSYPGEFNYSKINNFAVDQACGEIIGLINNDIEVISANWMEEMVSHAIRPGVGAVGAMLYYPDETIQHAGVLVGLCGVAGHIGSRMPRGSQGYFGRMLLTQELSAVTAACLLVKKSIYLEVGGLDADLKVAFNDVDFCLRIRKRGYRNIWTPFAELYHHESASRGLEDNPVKQARFDAEVSFMRARWSDVLKQDPAYSPNLSLATPFALNS